MSEQRTSDLVTLSGLWKQESKSGETYLSGKLRKDDIARLLEAAGDGGVRVLIFANRYKQGDRDPDMKLNVAPDRLDGPRTASVPSQASGLSAPRGASGGGVGGSDVPF
jgi:hypothetical protein